MKWWLILVLLLVACVRVQQPETPISVETSVETPETSAELVPDAVESPVVPIDVSRAKKTFNVEADDKGFYPNILDVVEGTEVTIIFHIREKNIDQGGLEIKSAYFDTGPRFIDAYATVMFNATKSFSFASYWPDTIVYKAAGKVNVQ